MNIQELRDTKSKLEQIVNYCPPESLSDHVWEVAEKRAMAAESRLAKMEATFALLDTIDELTARINALAARLDTLERDWGSGVAHVQLLAARLERLERLTARIDNLEAAIACGGCGQNVAWTCPNCGFGNEGAPEVYIIEEEQA